MIRADKIPDSDHQEWLNGLSDYAGVYLVAMQLPDESICVKIGSSSNPSRRYEAILTYLPFDSVMKWCPLGFSAGQIERFEKHLHSKFSDWHTKGEWFLFNATESGSLNKAVDAEIRKVFKHEPMWIEIDPNQNLLKRLTKMTAKSAGKSTGGRRRSLHKNRRVNPSDYL